MTATPIFGGPDFAIKLSANQQPTTTRGVVKDFAQLFPERLTIFQSSLRHKRGVHRYHQKPRFPALRWKDYPESTRPLRPTFGTNKHRPTFPPPGSQKGIKSNTNPTFMDQQPLSTTMHHPPIYFDIHHPQIASPSTTPHSGSFPFAAPSQRVFQVPTNRNPFFRSPKV